MDVRPVDLEIDAFLRRVLIACAKEDGVVIEPYASTRARDEMGWSHDDVREFLPLLTRDDLIEIVPWRRDKKVGLWRFLAPVDDTGDVWAELVLFVQTGVVLVVSCHISDGEGEP